MRRQGTEIWLRINSDCLTGQFSDLDVNDVKAKENYFTYNINTAKLTTSIKIVQQIIVFIAVLK